ncbi:NAD(P)H-dependent flavin oxidoreductase [Sorangium sp. So ce385]|uniref:NAD(P)H-dependent flavin oxidoreductase n=1 Tax=Sorangium sp. So ce385 TaxID=3133308 RepID=UPI003F5B1A36
MWTDTRLTRQLGLRLPIIQGPFGGGLSTTALAAAVSNAGGLGSFGAHALTPSQIGDLIPELRRLTPHPFAVNLWVPQPGEPTTIDAAELERHVARLRPMLRQLGLPDPEVPSAFAPRFEEQVEAALQARPQALSFVMGVPPAPVIEGAKARGIAVIGTATTVDEAIALDQAGVDIIVASGSDAGGHRGAFLRPVRESLVGTLSLVPQVVDAVRAPVVAAGGIADGRGVAAALALGASGVQIGTAFLACEESGASAGHRSALASPGARTTVLTRVFSGRTARGIPNAFVEALTPHEHDIPEYPVQNWLTQPIRRAAAAAGREDYLSLWAGQSAALARPRPAAELVAALVEQAEQVIRGLMQP